MRNLLSCLLAAWVLIGAPTAYGKPTRWLEFKAASGFQLKYPADWFMIEKSPANILDISSSRDRVEAVIIPRGAQMISALEKSVVPNDDYLADFKSKNPDDRFISYDKIDIAAAPDNACKKIHVVKSADEVGPHTFYLEHHLYCRIGRRSFTVALTQWEADPFNRASYEIATEILKSLRVKP